MFKEYEFFVYIMASRSRNLYVGITNDLAHRVAQHKAGKSKFTSRYKIDRLVYFERFLYVDKAIAREKELKDWAREWKVQLIEQGNPTWDDLAVAPPKRYTPGEELKADSSALLRNDKK